MSLFGQLDAENIPSNPFWVEAGDYSAEVTKALYKENRDGDRQLVIGYTITDEDSEFVDKQVFQYFTLPDPEMTPAMFEILPAEEKKRLRGKLAAMKRTLCGDDVNEKQKGLGLSIADMNDPDWDPKSLVGIKVTVGVKNYGANNTGVTVQWVNLQD